MKPTLTFLFLAVATSCFAQNKNTYYVKNDGSYVSTVDSADFTRIVAKADTGEMYNVADFYKSGKPKLVGNSTTLRPVNFDGQAIEFFENGKQKRVSNYKEKALLGDEFFFFPNGKPYITKRHRSKYQNSVALIVANYDSLGNVLVNDGNGYYRGYNNSFTQNAEEGMLKNSQRDGEWKGKEETISFVETYKDGLLIQGVATLPTGVETTYKDGRSTLTTFPGGPDKFNKFLAQSVRYPRQDRESNKQGKVTATFDVDTNGKINNIKIISATTKPMAAEMIRVLQLSPNWIPAKKFGRNVIESFTQSLSFNLGGNFMSPGEFLKAITSQPDKH